MNQCELLKRKIIVPFPAAVLTRKWGDDIFRREWSRDLKCILYKHLQKNDFVWSV